jgi:excisionase family DNA binding protein
MTATGIEIVKSSSSLEEPRGRSEYFLEFLTVKEVAAALRVPPSWVYERVRKRGKDRMPHLKIGKYLRFRLSEIRTWVDRGEAR